MTEKEDIVHFDYPDFSLSNYLGWKSSDNSVNRVYENSIKLIRNRRVTRLIIPNGNYKHPDHTALNYAGLYYGVLATDCVNMDWGEPTDIKSYYEYLTPKCCDTCCILRRNQ